MLGDQGRWEISSFMVDVHDVGQTTSEKWQTVEAFLVCNYEMIYFGEQANFLYLCPKAFPAIILADRLI